MFDTLRQDDRPNGMKYFTSLIISLVVHTVVLSVLVVVPLVYFNALHADELVTFLFATPTIPLPPPTPVAPPVAGSGGIEKTKPTTTRIAFNPVPERIRIGVPKDDDTPIIIATNEIADGIGFSPLGTTNGRGVNDLLDQIKPRAVAAPKPPAIRTPVRVGSMQEAKLIHRVEPVYSKIAIAARVSETVIMELVIDEEGNVANVTVLKGHPLLNDAAIRAVKQWKYSPTIQNGEPVQVLATVTVFFRIR
jgi:periplasmic protein TonB